MTINAGAQGRRIVVRHTIAGRGPSGGPAMTDVLGINPLSAAWGGAGGSREEELHEALDALVRMQVDARAEARAARDFETADRIRDGLVEAGIAVEDTPGGARWNLKKEH